MKAPHILIWIDSGYFYAGVVLDEHNTVIRAAPILKYMHGWSGDRVVGYAKSKRWKYGNAFKK